MWDLGNASSVGRRASGLRGAASPATHPADPVAAGQVVPKMDRVQRGRAHRAWVYWRGLPPASIPYPANIEARRAIRTAGLKLLRGLHEDELRRYERIVIVGHSLGSVIAYDLITWFWQEQHHRVELKEANQASERFCRPLPRTCQITQVRRLDKLRRLACPPPRSLPGCPVERLAKTVANKGLPWLITDLVTLGSPLTYANVLLADGPRNLKVAKTSA